MAVPVPYHRYHHLRGLTGRELLVGSKQGTDTPYLIEVDSYSLFIGRSRLAARSPWWCGQYRLSTHASRQRLCPPPTQSVPLSIVPVTIPPCIDRLIWKILYLPRHRVTTANTFLRPQTIVLPVVKRAPTLVFQSCCCRRASLLPSSRTHL